MTYTGIPIIHYISRQLPAPSLNFHIYINGNRDLAQSLLERIKISKGKAPITEQGKY